MSADANAYCICEDCKDLSCGDRQLGQPSLMIGMKEKTKGVNCGWTVFLNKEKREFMMGLNQLKDR